MTPGHHDHIHRLLVDSGRHVTRPHHAHWQVELMPGQTATLMGEEDAFRLEAALQMPAAGPQPLAAQAARLLEIGATLAGNAKYLLTEEGRLHVSAELWTPDLEGSGQDLILALDGLEAGVRCLQALATSGEPVNDATPGISPAVNASDLEEAAVQCGWPWDRRSDGGLGFKLEGDVALGEAVLAAPARGPVCLAVKVTLDGPPEVVESPAFTEFLLRVNTLLLGPRAVLRRSQEGAPKAVLERSWLRVPHPESLRLALESLNVASQLVGYELRALADAALARAYQEAAQTLSPT